MLRKRPVVQRTEEAAHEIGAHDERLIAVLRVGCQERVEVRHVEADPLPGLVFRFLSGRGGIPPDQLLLLAPRLAGEVRRCAVVENAPVGRPREAPAVREVIVALGGFARGGLVDELAVRGLHGNARVDPAAGRRLAVIGELGERGDGLPLPVDHLAVLVGDFLCRDAVDLLQDLDHLRVIGLGPIGEVGGEEATVAFLLAARVHLLEAMSQRADELRVGLHVARRIDGLLVPLDQPHRIGEAAVLLCGRRGRDEEDFRLDVLGVLAGLLPDFCGLREEDVDHDEPVETLHPGASELGVGAAHRGILPVGEKALDDAVVHVHEHVLMTVGIRRCALGDPLIPELVVLGGRVAVERLEQAHHELRLVHPEAALRRLLLEVRLEIGMRVAQRHGEVSGQLVVEQLQIGGALHVRVTAERGDAAARPPDIAE